MYVLLDWDYPLGYIYENNPAVVDTDGIAFHCIVTMVFMIRAAEQLSERRQSTFLDDF